MDKFVYNQMLQKCLEKHVQFTMAFGEIGITMGDILLKCLISNLKSMWVIHYEFMSDISM